MSLAQKILRLSPKWKPHILALAGVMGIVFVGMLGINAMFDKFRSGPRGWGKVDSIGELAGPSLVADRG